VKSSIIYCFNTINLLSKEYFILVIVLQSFLAVPSSELLPSFINFHIWTIVWLDLSVMRILFESRNLWDHIIHIKCIKSICTLGSFFPFSMKRLRFHFLNFLPFWTIRICFEWENFILLSLNYDLILAAYSNIALKSICVKFWIWLDQVRYMINGEI